MSSGDKLACILDQATAAVGGSGILGLGIGFIIIFPLWYVSDGHAAPPTIATVLLSVMLLPMVPASYQSTVMTVLVMGGVSGLIAVARAYVLNPAAG
jgi:hypothetical protein